MPSKKRKKGPTKGTGGQGQRSLRGKGNTPPAEQRHWYAERQKARSAKRPQRPAAAGPETPGHAAGAPRARAPRDGGPELLVGRNPVVEALRAHVPATRMFLCNSLERDARVNEAARLAGATGVEIQEVSRAELDRRCDSSGQPGAAHQGLALLVPPYRYWDPNDLRENAQQADTPPLIVALDGVTDPHNLGAIGRSAAAFGAHGLLIPERRAAGVTTTAWKTSAGAFARLPVAQVTNLTRTLREYQRYGLFVAGLDAEGDLRLDQLHLATDPLVLVVGSEGRGLSRLVRETCDVVASIPITGLESLNASVAAGVSLYEVTRRRTSAG